MEQRRERFGHAQGFTIRRAYSRKNEATSSRFRLTGLGGFTDRFLKNGSQLIARGRFIAMTSSYCWHFTVHKRESKNPCARVHV
jgi:hypothetical protein